MTTLSDKCSAMENMVLDCLNKIRSIHIVWFFFAGICVNLLLQICISPIYYRDSSLYYQMVQSFVLSDWERAFPLYLPIFYPMLAGILAKCGMPVMPAMVLVSGIFYALIVFPLYSLLKRFFPERQALVGLLLFALNYEAASAGCAPLLDSGRLFFMVALMALIFADESFSWKRLLLFGACYAGLSLVRSEGVVLAGILMAAHLGWLRFQHRVGFLPALGRVALSGVIMLVLCLPRLVQFWCETGIPALEIRQVNAITHIWSSLFPDHAFALKDYAFCGANVMDYSAQALWGNVRFYRNFADGFLPIYLPFTIWGAVVTIRGRKWDAKYSILLFIFIAYTVFHFIVEAAAGRYFLINCYLALPLTVTGVVSVFELSRRKSVWLNRALMAAAAVAAGILVYKSVFFTNPQLRRDYDAFAAALRREFPGRRVNLLIIGTDRGTGYYWGVNTCFYRNYPRGLVSRMTLKEVLTDGVDGREIDYRHEKTLASPVHFDAVLLQNSVREDLVGKSDLLAEADVIIRNRKYTLYRNSQSPQKHKDR